MKKWAHELNREFSKERGTNDQYIHEKVFSGYERNANQNYTFMSPQLE
jgi:hypothetical protein